MSLSLRLTLHGEELIDTSDPRKLKEIARTVPNETLSLAIRIDQVLVAARVVITDHAGEMVTMDGTPILAALSSYVDTPDVNFESWFYHQSRSAINGRIEFRSPSNALFRLVLQAVANGLATIQSVTLPDSFTLELTKKEIHHG